MRNRKGVDLDGRRDGEKMGVVVGKTKLQEKNIKIFIYRGRNLKSLLDSTIDISRLLDQHIVHG